MILQPSATHRRVAPGLAWAFVPLASGALAAGLAAIGARRSLTLAETDSLLHASGSWSRLAPLTHIDASGSLYLIGMKGWLHVGSAEWVVRAPSIAACGLTALVVALLGWRLFDRWVGAAAGVIFATTAFSLDAGRSAGPLAVATLAITLATLLFVLALETRSATLLALYAVAGVAAVYVHVSSATVLLAHACALVAWRGAACRRAAWASGLAVLLASPAVVLAVVHRRHVVDPLGQPRFGDVAQAIHDVSGQNLVLLAAGVVAVLALATSRLVGGEMWKAVLLVAWVALPVAGLLALSMVRPSFDTRYLAVSAPGWSVLAAAGVRALRRELAVAAAVALLAVAGVRISQLSDRQDEEWRSAVRYAFTARAPGDRVVAAPARAIGVLSHYAGVDRGSVTAGGPTAYVLVRAQSAEEALEIARRAVRAPSYALRGTRRFGRHLWAQRWERTGLPPG